MKNYEVYRKFTCFEVFKVSAKDEEDAQRLVDEGLVEIDRTEEEEGGLIDYQIMEIK